MGDWLKKYGEAIYGTVPFEVASEGVTKADNEDYNIERVRQQMKDGIALESGQYRLTGLDFRFTRKGKNVYVLAMGAPEDGRYTVRALGRSGCVKGDISVTVPGLEVSCPFERTDEALTIHLPEGLPGESIYALRVTQI